MADDVPTRPLLAGCPICSKRGDYHAGPGEPFYRCATCRLLWPAEQRPPVVLPAHVTLALSGRYDG